MWVVWRVCVWYEEGVWVVCGVGCEVWSVCGLCGWCVYGMRRVCGEGGVCGGNHANCFNALIQPTVKREQLLDIN